VKEISNNKWLCKMYEKFLLPFSTCTHMIIRAPTERSSQITMELTLDKDFVGDVSEIKQGAIISFKFSGYYSGGRPMNPRIFCVRKDIRSWTEMLQQSQKKLVSGNITLRC
jgi:hypothetical protein